MNPIIFAMRRPTGDEDLIGVNVAAFREGQQVEVVEAKK